MRNLTRRVLGVSVWVLAVIVAGAVASAVPANGGAAARTGQAQAAGGSGYHLEKKVKLGGEGGWDYLTVDHAMHRIFITRGTHVMVVDSRTYEAAGDIPGLHRSHGVALAPKLHHGFVSDGQPGSVVMFDYSTLKVLATTPTNPDSDAILYDPASQRVFTMNGDPGTATVIDAATGKIVKVLPLGGKPEFAVTDGKGHVFANLEDKSELVRINSKDLTVEQTWPLAPCESPSGLAIDAAHERLFSGCHSGAMTFMDGDSGKMLGTVPIGRGVDANRFDSGTGFAFASCGDGTITVAHEDSPEKLSPLDTIQTMRGARTMAIDRVTHTIYTVTAEFAPPPAGAEGQRRRPSFAPGSFTLLVYSR